MRRDPRYRLLSVRQTWAIHGVLGIVVVGMLVLARMTGNPGLYAMPGAILGGEIAGWLILQRKAARIIQRMSDAAVLVEQGHYGTAALQIDELALRARLIPNLHALLAHRRLDIHFALGELEPAESLGRAIIASGWFTRPRGALFVAFPQVCATLAVIAALRGHSERAESWREQARAAVSPGRASTLVFMDAVLDARAERYANVAKLQLVAARGPYGSVMRWILAYAAASSVPDLAAQRTEAARGSTAEALALAPYWPELAAFVSASA